MFIQYYECWYFIIGTSLIFIHCEAYFKIIAHIGLFLLRKISKPLELFYKNILKNR